MAKKIAVITGGASGMGLESAKRLAGTGKWTLHLLDLNPAAGEAALQAIPDANFHAVNVTSYESVSRTFQKIFEKEGQIDFVFANAGIVERNSFYEKQATKGSEPPPPPNMATLDINMNGVVTTTHLALHYMRLSPHGGKGASIVMTASSGSLYPSEFTPIYAASKAGVLNFMRSIAFPFHHDDGIRVYAICPGTVRTNLLLADEWKSFPDEFFTPVSKIASTVQMLVNGGDLKDSAGRNVAAGSDYGLAVEVCGNNHYFRDQVPYCDDAMKQVMTATSMSNQQASFDEAKKRGVAA